MSLSEIRGYVRALASRCVVAEVETVLVRRHLNQTLQARVADAAVSQLVTMVAHDVLSGETPTSIRNLAA